MILELVMLGQVGVSPSPFWCDVCPPRPVTDGTSQTSMVYRVASFVVDYSHCPSLLPLYVSLPPPFRDGLIGSPWFDSRGLDLAGTTHAARRQCVLFGMGSNVHAHVAQASMWGFGDCQSVTCTLHMFSWPPKYLSFAPLINCDVAIQCLCSLRPSARKKRLRLPSSPVRPAHFGPQSENGAVEPYRPLAAIGLAQERDE